MGHDNIENNTSSRLNPNPEERSKISQSLASPPSSFKNPFDAIPSGDIPDEEPVNQGEDRPQELDGVADHCRLHSFDASMDYASIGSQFMGEGASSMAGFINPRQNNCATDGSEQDSEQTRRVKAESIDVNAGGYEPYMDPIIVPMNRPPQVRVTKVP